MLHSKGEFANYLMEHIQNQDSDDYDSDKESIKSDLMEVPGFAKAMSEKSSRLRRPESVRSSTLSIGSSKRSSKIPSVYHGPAWSSPSKGDLMKAETVEKSSVKRSVYLYYLKSLGFKIMGVAYASLILTQVPSKAYFEKGSNVIKFIMELPFQGFKFGHKCVVVQMVK